MKNYVKRLIGFVLFTLSFIIQCMLAILGVFVLTVAIGVIKMLIVNGSYSVVGIFVGNYVVQFSIIAVMVVTLINAEWLSNILDK